jgi:threonine dehydrogenase-like Zn-dependent dehydrogenase
MVGRISRLGSSVTGSKVGDLVFAYAPHGSHAVVAEQNAIPLGELMNEETGVFLANLNTAYNGVLDANLPLGADVVVMGLGVIGQIAVRLLKLGGARQIIAIDGIAMRRRLAIEGGAHQTLHPSDDVAGAVRQLTNGRGADAVIEVSGAVPALNEAIRTVGYNGTVIAMSWYGGTFETLSLSGEFHHNRPRIISSQVGAVNPFLGPLWSTERRATIAREYLSLFNADLRAFITHRIPLSNAADAYRLIDQGSPEIMQVLIDYRS